MTDFTVQPIWGYPSKLLATTRQAAEEINDRYQAVGDCAEYVRQQAAQLRAAADNLLSVVDGAIAQLSQQQAQFNSLASVAGDRIATANGLQATAQSSTDRMAANNTAVVTARGKITAADAIADATIANALPRSSNLVGIAGAARSNPGILGMDGAGNWNWYAAPSGQPFVIEFVSFSQIASASTNGGAVTAASWNVADINSANFGNFRTVLGFPENVVETDNDRLALKPWLHYIRAVAIASNTDWVRSRFTLAGTGIGRSLSTQMVSDSNTAIARHFNLEVFCDRIVEPAADAFLQLQTYHPIANPAIPSAARGVAGNAGNANIYLTAWCYRIRYT